MQEQGTGDANGREGEAGAGGETVGGGDQLIIKVGPGITAAVGDQVGGTAEVGDGAGNGGFVVPGPLDFGIEDAARTEVQGGGRNQTDGVAWGQGAT